MFSMFPVVALTECTLDQANVLLVLWGHRMGPLHRGNQGAVCHVLLNGSHPVAVTTASNLISPVVGNANWLMRENTIELSRLCAERKDINRAMLRLWREFVFPTLNYQYAMSYQDADIHNGNTYRFDGWERVAYSSSGPDTRSGRKGRNKWVWQWPPSNIGVQTDRASSQAQQP